MLKKLLTIALLALAVAVQAQPHREHRALWLTAYLGEWPSGALTSQSAVNRQVKNLQNQLDDLKANNYNTIYFHVRSHCDAMYESSYEPWAACVGDKRGDAPLIDPLATIIEECHKRGIELYAWINPYRYAGKSLYGGNNEKNYETSHPDWLLTIAGKESILNPGLPEVRQRIVDVTREIITKYDVDGVVFDDYFYTNGTAMEKDADLYEAYQKGGGKLSQPDWRRANVNAMVRDVRDCIAATKPYLNFGISPAGPCNPPNIADYGLSASTMSDWQYNGIYSDPVAWLNEGIIDMVSPQVYRSRASHFLDYSEWWINTANHFGRNISVSTSTGIIEDANCKADEFIAQQEYVRTLQPVNHSGLTIFGYSKFQTYREKDPVLDENKNLAYFMGQTVYAQPALQVTRPWRNSYEPRMVSNITVSGTSVSWTPAREGDRYTVYDLSGSAPVMLGVTYTPNYTLPEGSTDKIGVCVYDRYGNEYSMLEAGKTASAGQAPRLVYPAAGGTYAPLSNFRWEGNAQTYTVVIAKDGNDIMTFDTDTPELPSSQFLGLKQGQVYTWRVIAKGLNTLDAESAPQEFVLSSMLINTPAQGASDVAECALFDVTKAADGAVYTVEISTTEKFNSVSYTGTFNSNVFTLPEQAISTGVTYYARVTASLDGHSMTSPIVKFTSATVDYTDAPIFVNPVNPGETVYSNNSIIVEPWHGLNGVTIEVSETDQFPTRGATAQSTLVNFDTTTKPLGEWRISSKSLVDGKTYYLRARGRYMKGGSSTAYTPYTPVMTFVYSASTGVESVVADGAQLTGNVYNLQGILLIENATPDQVNALPAGLYIVGNTKVLVK